MRNKALIRVQILILVVLVGLVIWRMGGGGEAEMGFVSFSSMDTGRLYETSFRADEEGIVRLVATGAFENDREGSELAVYPWVVDRTRHEVAWLPTARDAVRDGVLARFDETFGVTPGVYTVYFTTFGPNPESIEGGSFLGLKPHWTNYESVWSLALVDESSSGTYRQVGRSAMEDSGDRNEPFWTSKPASNRANKSVLLRTSAPTEVLVSATAETCASGCDQARIVSMPEENVQWELTSANSEPAGGWIANRTFDGGIRLAKGVFRAELKTNSTHAYRSWRANPPWFPDEWGLELATTEPGSVTIVDPWADSAPIISMTRVGDSESRRVQIRVLETVQVVISALGEISSGGSLYDFAKVERDADQSTLWSMSWSGSEPAGGHSYNRKETAFLTLPPGTYTFHYQSDDSHAFDDWNKARPDFPERWGMAVFPLDVGRFDPDDIEILSRPEQTSVVVNGATPAKTGHVLVSLTSLTDEVQVHETFTLLEESNVRVVALGEISTSGRYDYGWIEDADSGAHVWDMTLQNTRHAGGDDRNRKFDGVLTLPPGTYSVHFVTDFGWAYGGFGEGAPDNPSQWGIAVYESEN